MSATPDSTLANPEQLIADLRRQLAECKAERDEGLERETATAEILQVINSSPGDLAPVFDAMLEKALRLCEADLGTFWTYDGDSFEAASLRGAPPEQAKFLTGRRHRPGAGTLHALLLSGENLVHIADLADTDAYRSGELTRRQSVDVAGARSVLAVPLRRAGQLLGLINIYRREVRSFSDKQIALLQNFAAQAVIAMENARLLTETREALEQQTATAEVLQVINSSPGDLAPVFDAMLERATRLCDAPCAMLWTYNGEAFSVPATFGVPEAFTEYLRKPLEIQPSVFLEALRHGETFVHNLDLADTGSYRGGNPLNRAVVDLGGARTGLLVPLQKDGRFLGAFRIYRQEVQPFSDKQIALLQSFAAQAVIAMENARLMTETREALEQQTATAEVLQVINSSPGDLAPVFDAMLERAMRLCGAAFGMMHMYDGKTVHPVAMRGIPPGFAEFAADPASQPGPGGATPRLAAGARFVHIADLMEEEAYRSGEAYRRALVDLGGARTLLAVPLRKDDVMLGQIAIYRTEARPYADKQIALLQNFAAQAVIAMENARLLTETREALEQQTATAEVLQVINSSPGDLAPVFDAMLEKAMRLCGAAFGQLYTYDGECFHRVALRGAPPALEEIFRAPVLPTPGSVARRVADGETVVCELDAREGAAYRQGAPAMRALVEIGGARSFVFVALRKDDQLLGGIAVYRREVRPFTDKQIALLENFAAQAVIAMENARLLTETREALEQQTATAEVLQVINSSPGDLAPVFDAILEKAVSLAEAVYAHLWRFDGEHFHPWRSHGEPEFARWFADLGPVMPNPDGDGFLGRVVRGERLLYIADLRNTEAYRSGYAPVTALADVGGGRSVLTVALRKDHTVLGVLTVYRREVKQFSEKQISLLENFAAQAVIAMENARLLTETREALAQQTATAEILEVINRSPGDLAPVFEAILDKAHSLCGAEIGRLFTYDGTCFGSVAARGAAARYGELRPHSFRPPPGNPFAQLLEGQPLVHIADVRDLLAQLPDDPGLQVAVEVGMRTFLLVPLHKDDVLLGAISASRSEVRPFSDKQVSLLQNFAAQAVIAMDNARLLDEIRQRQAELRVTFDNMGDGVAMFDAELRLAAWNMNFQRILELPDPLLVDRPRVADFVRYLATHGEYGTVDVEAEVRRLSERVATQWSAERTRPDGRVIEVRSNPVPGGGVVLIYSDITERKRAEEEIRAARDTAERALQELQTAQASLLHAQKMAALGQLTAGIAHEIKNPLNFVNNFAELSGELLLELKETTAPAVAALGDDERAAVNEVVAMLRGNLDKITEHGKRADGIVKSMLEHSRGVSGERRVVDLNALIEEALNLAYHGARAQDASFNITLERDFDRGLAPVELAPQEMTRVLLNIFGNGFYATSKRQRDGAGPDGPDFQPRLKVATRQLGDAVEVRVRDNGTGIAPEIRDKLFQPFVTTKPTGEGTGLGLSIAWDIVTQQHGGTISVDSQVGEFAEFTVRLPRAYGATIAEAVA